MKPSNYYAVIALLFMTLCSTDTLSGQASEHVLFIGNSYTAFNNLPNMVSQMAESTGDTLNFSSHTPGGQSLSNHASNSAALGLIAQGDWDHVVIQGQSQEPSFPLAQVQTQTFPFAQTLCDSVRSANPCTRPIFYMTWGRKNGDASNCVNWPPVCTYEGMDDLLRERYQLMGEMNEAYVSPAGAVWRHLREGGSSIELYTADESHPSLAGSYAAACAFYAIIFEKDPLLITANLGLDSDQALEIRQAAHEVAYINLTEWNVGQFDPIANLSASLVSGFTYEFNDASLYADTIYWFSETGLPGDSINHVFPGPGTHTITLIAERCGVADTLDYELNISPNSINDYHLTELSLYPNPASVELFVDSKWIGASFEIHDEIGSLVKRDSLNGSIDISDLQAGLYLISVQDNNGRKGLGQFVVER